MTTETIGRRVKRLRQAVDLNQRSLADKAGLSFMEIVYLEIDRQGLSSGALRRIARVLGCTFDELVNPGDQESA